MAAKVDVCFRSVVVEWLESQDQEILGLVPGGLGKHPALEPVEPPAHLTHEAPDDHREWQSSDQHLGNDRPESRMVELGAICLFRRVHPDVHRDDDNVHCLVRDRHADLRKAELKVLASANPRDKALVVLLQSRDHADARRPHGGVRKPGRGVEEVISLTTKDENVPIQVGANRGVWARVRERPVRRMRSKHQAASSRLTPGGVHGV
mmetsp:Transcript_14046/g.44996  ORF Transcript_14046/g.44996 Transcript_14046/m.44996 type:complete len:207 (-) Transcript_14046:775-1395(-)